MYADDVLLLSAAVNIFQLMIDARNTCGDEHCIQIVNWEAIKGGRRGGIWLPIFRHCILQQYLTLLQAFGLIIKLQIVN